VPKILEVPESVYKREDGRWCKPCPSCKEEQDYLRKNYAIQSFNLGKTCKKCSNSKTDNCHRGYTGFVRTSWFNQKIAQGALRGWEASITAEDINQLYLAQNKKCALSGLDIGWAEVGQNHTASIDRIDSTKGYTLENIQLVHKDINMMKQQYDNDHFIKMCALVACKFK
jgi:hypothetical protein